MIKFISKYIAKKYINRHKDDGTLINITNNTIKSIDIYEDLVIYTVIYIICSILVIIGVPIGTYLLTRGHDPALWALLSLIVSIISMARIFFSLIKFILKDVYEIILDVANLYNYGTWNHDIPMVFPVNHWIGFSMK